MKGGEISPEPVGEGHAVWLKRYKGQFLRFCPGTRHYRCCGYRIAHIGENCPVGCSYCILQAYFQDRLLKVWANQEDLYAELGKALSANPEHRLRMGTGEFTDSLALEPLTGVASGLVEFLGEYPNACLELKSKVVDLSWLPMVKRSDRVLPAWSMNAPRIVAEQEGLAASLEERLRAARHCASLGFRICLHFDPIIRFPGWDDPKVGYPATVEMIRDHLTPEQVAYISLGSFRFMPQLKSVIEANHPKQRISMRNTGQDWTTSSGCCAPLVWSSFARWPERSPGRDSAMPCISAWSPIPCGGRSWGEFPGSWGGWPNISKRGPLRREHERGQPLVPSEEFCYVSGAASTCENAAVARQR